MATSLVRTWISVLHLALFATTSGLGLLANGAPRRHTVTVSGGTSGSTFNRDFLDEIQPFYSPDTATELMGPLLYSLGKAPARAQAGT